MLSAEEIITGNVELASPPEIFLKISTSMDDPSKNAKDFASIINNDAGLAARLLRLVNSAFFSFSANITSISHAVSIIGTKELRNLVLATVVIERFSNLPNGLISMKEFWSLSVKSALFSRSIGQNHNKNPEMEDLFICGLLHGIGKIIIYSKIPELARSAILLSESSSIPEDQAQRETFGFDYAETGAALAKQWQLPEIIRSTLSYQLNPEDGQPYSTESGIVNIARRLSSIDLTDEALVEEEFGPKDSVWELIGLNKTILSIVIPEVEASFSETRQTFF